MGRKIKVFCKKTGQEFSSFQEAGRELGVDSWTLSKKIETNGFFVDKDGYKWERETPMKTKNKYEKTTPYYKKMKKRLFSHRKANESLPSVSGGLFPIPKERFKGCVDLHEVNFGTQPIEDCPADVRESVKNIVMYLLKDSGVYDKITNLLDTCGLKRITITTDKKVFCKNHLQNHVQEQKFPLVPSTLHYSQTPST